MKLEKYTKIRQEFQSPKQAARMPVSSSDCEWFASRGVSSYFFVMSIKKQLLLRKHEDKRIGQGHLWAFSNEIKEVRGAPEAGDVVELRDHGGKFIGRGFYNPRSLIAFRLLTRDDKEIDAEFFRLQIEQAARLRRQVIGSTRMFRLVHGEGDGLPGLIIDRYGDYFSVQTYSLGMDMWLTPICDALDSLFSPKGIVERNESSLRSFEGLKERTGVLRGEANRTRETDGDVMFDVDLLGGQKTGLFLDQRENRFLVRRYSAGCRVLDCFCNDGGFALHAARAGAASVLGIDISEGAIIRSRVNAELNNLTNICFFERADVFEFLAAGIHKEERYDLIVLDPPSFTKSKKTIATARRGYKEINTAAMRLLSPGGILATASCSHHISREMFTEIIAASANKAGRIARILEWHGAAPDHPVLPAMPETEYLKLAIVHVD